MPAKQRLADDWTRINNSEVARRAINRIEARGEGILLLHDIHPRTVLALPEILNELKSRGYKIRSCGSGSRGPAENYHFRGRTRWALLGICRADQQNQNGARRNGAAHDPF